MNNIRREKLRKFLEQNEVATLRQMEELFPDVSLMTIHRDLSFLQEQGLVEKIRGGARYKKGGDSEPVFAARAIVNRTAKQVLAEKALPLLEGCSSVFLDAGTTILSFAKCIPDLPVNIVTTGPNIALELCNRKSMAITLSGGLLHKSNLMLTGSPAEETLSRLNIDIAFLVPSGYSLTAEFSCGRESEARIKALAAHKARTKVMLMDASKLDKVFPHTFARLGELDYIITEQEPEALPFGLLQAAAQVPGLRII